MTLDKSMDYLSQDQVYMASGNIRLPDGKGNTTLKSISMYHQLHCLAKMRLTLQQAREGVDIGVGWRDDAHWPHCFDYLHSSILCFADGTLESVSLQPGPTVGTAVRVIDASLETRHCRDSKPLEELLPFTVSKSRIVQLAQLISSGITVIDTHLGDNGLSTPSFNPDSPVQVVTQEDMVRVKYEVLGATIELRQLLEGPMKLLPESNFAPLAAVYNFDIASKVPIDATISFADLFSNKGYVAHTAASKMLAENQVARDLMGLTFQECWPAHSRAVEAMAHKSEDAGVSGYALANNFANSSMTTFDFLSKNADRA
ncbi:O-methyltransferase [Trichophyton violaceum]|uniref:O-methyltransferase n=1 Tax=Trichophyton violaceum TaxID=34388 RepID=A0A178FLH2_TRIVO|nr:O-methyltransferase [Trichophyton violaceum]